MKINDPYIDNFGNKYYFKYENGCLHRIDGPAQEFVDGKKYWFINDNNIECNSQEEFERSKEYREYKLRAFS